MKFKINDAEYRISFRYSEDFSVTEALIINQEMGNVSVRGEARRHPNDSQDREKGRRVALTNAIRLLDREYRKCIWNAYNNRGKVQQEPVRPKSMRISLWESLSDAAKRLVGRR
jgi:hypothetical protein